MIRSPHGFLFPRAALLAFLMTAAVVLTAVSPAAAHGELVESRPAAGTIVGGEITSVELQFVGITHPGDHLVTVTRPDGTNVRSNGPMIQDFQRLILNTEVLTIPGEYLVNYRVDGVDGDIAVATFGFTFDPGAPPAAALTKVQGPPGDEPRTALNVMIVLTAVLATLVVAWIGRRLWVTR